MTTDRRSRGREMNEDVVYELLLTEGPSTRTALARRAELSKPSVSDIIESLQAAGVVHPTGRVQGRSGPTATVFEIRPSVAHGIGIDLGGTKIHGVIGDLNGEVLDERRVPTDRRGGPHVVEQIASICHELVAGLPDDAGGVDHVAIGSPGVVDPATGLMRLAYNLPGFDRIDLAKELEARVPAAVHVDNDVNMSAEGERVDPTSPSSDNFVYLSIGTGIGAAIVLDGEVRRGHRGAAGEIAYLPIGSDPFDPRNQRRGPLEEAVDGQAILRRVAEQRAHVDTALPVDADVPEIFAAASRGDPLAVTVVSEEARLVAWAITAVTALVDPERIILGGGIGSSPALLAAVRGWCDRMMPEPPLVERSTLGTRAPLVGALSVSVGASREELLETRLRGRPPSRLAGHTRGRRLAPHLHQVAAPAPDHGRGRAGSPERTTDA